MPDAASTEFSDTPRITRLAPSPTGVLHLGNAMSFLITWAIARQRGWRLLMRLEDIDTKRCSPELAASVYDILHWIGIEWDGPPLIQTDRIAAHRAALDVLKQRALVYPCEKSRTGAADELFNWRLHTPADPRLFDDSFFGPLSESPQEHGSDFIVWTKRDEPAYQLAVVVDDHAQGVTDIIRGNDLVESTPRQILLYEYLGLAPQPMYLHLPLVRGVDGKKLAKRHGDTRLTAYRAAGTPPEAVIGLIAHWCGMLEHPQLLSADAFVTGLDWNAIPRADIVFRPEHDQWLIRPTH